MATDEYVVCPDCGRADRLKEVAYRDTSQPVSGLHRSGEADDYDTFDWHEEVVAVGYSCSNCGWHDSVPVDDDNRDALVATIRSKMPAMGEGVQRYEFPAFVVVYAGRREWADRSAREVIEGRLPQGNDAYVTLDDGEPSREADDR